MTCLEAIAPLRPVSPTLSSPCDLRGYPQSDLLRISRAIRRVRCHQQTRPPPNHTHPAPKVFPLEATCRGRFGSARSSNQKDNGLCSAPTSHTLDLMISCKTLPPACASRVLSFALLHSPSDRGRDNLATEILDCNDDHVLLAELTHLYMYGLIRVCKLSVPFCLLSC